MSLYPYQPLLQTSIAQCLGLWLLSQGKRESGVCIQCPCTLSALPKKVVSVLPHRSTSRTGILLVAKNKESCSGLLLLAELCKIGRMCRIWGRESGGEEETMLPASWILTMFPKDWFLSCRTWRAEGWAWFGCLGTVKNKGKRQEACNTMHCSAWLGQGTEPGVSFQGGRKSKAWLQHPGLQ